MLAIGHILKHWKTVAISFVIGCWPTWYQRAPFYLDSPSVSSTVRLGNEGNVARPKQKLANGTRGSQAVSHPSTNLAQCCLTSGIGRELVFSAWYGRWQDDGLEFCQAISMKNATKGLAPTWQVSWQELRPGLLRPPGCQAHPTPAYFTSPRWQEFSKMASQACPALGQGILHGPGSKAGYARWAGGNGGG